MSNKTLFIKQLRRNRKNGPIEALEFEPGVNVIVGPGNTGKTKWLRMLDYLMGDPDKPEDTFGTGLAKKYDSIEGVFIIDGIEYLIERYWKEPGIKSKTLVNEEPKDSSEFSHFLLSKLEIPILHYPLGNPFSERSWSELSWRTLYRHIFRRQTLWGDFAEKQHQSVQLACMLQFLGLAEFIYSDDYEELINKRKQAYSLERRKEEFINILDEVSKELVEEKEIRVTLTNQSLDQAINRLQNEIQSLQQKRNLSLDELLEGSVKGESKDRDAYNQLGEIWGELQSAKEQNTLRLSNINTRLSELQDHKAALEREYAKLQRAKTAGRMLADLKITHCPACDQIVESINENSEQCFLCHRPIDINDDDSIHQRIDFEAKQLEEELKEIEDLISTILSDQQATISERRLINEEIQRVENQMRPVQQVAATILPPDLAVLDMESGRLQERIRQLERIKSTLERRESISKEIDQIQKEIGRLEIEVKKLEENVDLEISGDKISNGMNTYLNALEANKNNLWTQGPAYFWFRRGSYNVRVGDERWSTKLGGTLRLYFLLAYHYALLELTSFSGTHYPGLSILDLPATLEDGSTVKDKENFILEPFVNLVQQLDMKNTQVIATGAAFEGLEEANRIELTKVWQ